MKNEEMTARVDVRGTDGYLLLTEGNDENELYER
jgi:hypothetical protein